MPQVTPAIQMSQIVQVLPSVESGGGAALQIIGIILTQNTRVPIGQVLQFPTQAAVASFFGPTSQEAALASIYFLGFTGATARPAALLFAQYNVAPISGYMRSGNVAGLGLAAIQAVSGTLTIDIDGSPVSGTINLSGATSFSSAAQIIADTLDIPSLPVAAVFVGAISGTTLTVTGVNSGALAVGDVLAGVGVISGTYVSAFGSGTGGVGTYTVSASQTVSSTTITATQPAAVFTATATGTTLNVTGVISGALAVGQIINGAGVTSGTYIQALGSGTGGTGTYVLSASASAGSETMTADAPGVTYDSVSGSFVVTSATAGASSSVGYASGTAAAGLLMTQATGATLAAGAAALTPGTGAPTTFMTAITAITQNWVSFTTTWEPTVADKESFASWTNSQDDRYLYVLWTTDDLNTGSSGPSAEVAYVNENDLSGTAVVWDDPNIDPMGGQIAAFVMGYAASIDFSAVNGRATAAFRSQAGLAVQVTSGMVAQYLISYGVNFYGNYTTANQSFLWFQQGVVSGPFQWLDSYINQIWLNNQLQLSQAELLSNVKSVPYNAAGDGLLASSVQGPAQAGVTFGAIRTGVTLSPEQVAIINAQAGIAIDSTLFNQGWFFQTGIASAQVREARDSIPQTFWYCDGGSVQKLTLASIEIQ